MQGRGGDRDPFSNFGDPFAGFGGFGGFGGTMGPPRNLMSSFFGGRDPFDDAFFTRPFGGMFESSFFGPMGNTFTNIHQPPFIEDQAPEPKRSKGPIIEELDTDDEKEETDKSKNVNPKKHRSGKEPYVEDPDDEVEAQESRSKQLRHSSDYNKFNTLGQQPQARSFTFQSSSVTYGGANGAYYTSSKTRRMGSDGITIEDCKEADSSTRQATHKFSRGLHDKAHSVTRKLGSDGMVNTMQTLHNLNEDELAGFEEAWKGNVKQHLPGWTGSLSGHDNMGPNIAGHGGWALPSTAPSRQHPERIPQDFQARVGYPSQPERMRSSSDARANKSYPRGRARG